jgi:hypothetical protein
MARSKQARSLKLRQTVEFEFVPAAFVPFQSLRTLDVGKLETARHAVVEFGQFESNSCKRIVRAVIKDGQVTEVKLDACGDAKGRLTTGFARLLARAHSKQKRSRTPAPRLPMPVASFFVRRSTSGTITISGDVINGMICYSVCIDFFGTLICTTCCGTSSGDVICIGIRT